MSKTVTFAHALPTINVAQPTDRNSMRSRREAGIVLVFIGIIATVGYISPDSSEHAGRRFLSNKLRSQPKSIQQEPMNSKRIERSVKRKLTHHKSYYNSYYPSFSYPYQQYYGRYGYNYMSNPGYAAAYYQSQFPNGGTPYYQRPAVPYGGQMTSPIFNYGYQQLPAGGGAVAANVPAQIQVPQILTMPSVGSALGYGRSTFIQQPEIGGTGTQNAQSGPGRGQTGPGLSGIIGSLTEEGGLLDPAFLGSLARLFLDGNLESLALGALDIVNRIGEGEDVNSLLGDLTDIIFNGFLNGILPGAGDASGGSGNGADSGLMGELLNIVGNLDLDQLGSIELPLSPPSIVSPNILDDVLERFGLEADLGPPESVEREALNRFKSVPPQRITKTVNGRHIALVTLDDVLSNFSPSEKLSVAKVRTVLFIRYQISNPQTANEYIQFILKNEIPVIGAYIPGAPLNPTPLEFYDFSGKNSGELTFRDIMKILELFYDIHDPIAAESIALALERMGIDIVGYNPSSSREKANVRNTPNISTTKSTLVDRVNSATRLPSSSKIELTSPPVSKSRLAYGPSNPSKQEFLALFPHPDKITTTDLREVLKFYYNVFDEKTVVFVKEHMIKEWHIKLIS